MLQIVQDIEHRFGRIACCLGVQLAFFSASCLIVCAATIAIGQEPAGDDNLLPTTTAPIHATYGDQIQKLKTNYLPNAIQVHSRVVSGGLPQGDQAFAELQRLGIKTIISVDGMSPDIATAERHGLRYIHLPHGYDKVPEQRVLEIAKAFQSIDGKIYIHCHHGKHRSPAAAAAACVVSGWLDKKSALDVLVIAGTNPNYRGLFQSVSTSTRVDDDVLQSMQVEYRPIQPLAPMTDAMVKLEHALTQLLRFDERRWQTDAAIPEVTPAHEVLMVRELYTELLRADYVQSESAGFRSLLQTGARLAASLEQDLNRSESTTALSDAQMKSLRDKLHALQANCKTCHESHRDNR